MAILPTRAALSAPRNPKRNLAREIHRKLRAEILSGNIIPRAALAEPLRAMSSDRSRSICSRSLFAIAAALAFHALRVNGTTAPQEETFANTIQPLIKEFCIPCHSTEKQKGDLDLERFKSLEEINRDPSVWEHSLEQIRDGEMPPKDKPKPSAEQLHRLTNWMHTTLDEIALKNAGDPGPVVLRRLSNMEYTYSVRDLTGVVSLDPAKEFPVDGAAGEGFTNAGAALVMSPSLLSKYLDAAKQIASHAVLTPHGFWFSEHTSSRDWTNEILTKIRAIYTKYSSEGKPTEVIQQSIKMNTGAGGRLPIAQYLACLQGKQNADGLSPKYLKILRAALTSTQPSQLLETLRDKYAAGTLTAADIEPWQQSLWKLNSIGHLGKIDGPKSWMEPVTPLTAQHEIRLKLTPPADGSDLTLYLSTGDAGDGDTDDFAVWENARLVFEGRPDLHLMHVRAAIQHLANRRKEVIASTPQCLAAAHEAETAHQTADITNLARKYSVSATILQDWLNYLGIASTAETKLGPLLEKKRESAADYSFIKGWTGDTDLSVLANSSDQTVRIPGTMKPHSIAMHPSPKLASVLAWKSPVEASLRITGSVQDIHTSGGNGISWSLQLRRGNTSETLANGHSDSGKIIQMGTHEAVKVTHGDVIAVVIGAKNGDHTYDLTAVDLVVSDGVTDWNAAKELSPDILAGNPHADAHGHRDVWHFFGEPESSATAPPIPKNSILANWRHSKQLSARTELAQQLQQLLQKDIQTLRADTPEHSLHAQILSLNGPLLGSVLRSGKMIDDATPSAYGLDPSLFGKHPKGDAVAPNHLCVQAPHLLSVKLPAELVAGAEFVAAGHLHPSTSGEASVQLQASTTKPSLTKGLQSSGSSTKTESGPWTSSKTSVAFNAPILVHDGSVARKRFESSFEDFRQLFPAALCYTQIVPSDEVVTLTLFHREDAVLSRLMLEDREREELDHLWEQLHFVSQDALTLVDAFEQLWQYSTQDGPDKPNGDRRLAPLREPILKGAELFKKRLLEVEPQHVQEALQFASRAWRRPLTNAEESQLRALYQELRRKELPHVESIRMLIARALIAPAFLYRGERPGSGSTGTPVSDWELATRLSYFLWAGPPDDALLAEAKAGSLKNESALVAQTKRMIKDARIRRLSTEFGCQWLHVRDVATLDEKSERHFPTFHAIRSDLQEEVVLFFMDFFAENRSVLSLLDADHSFLNRPLAAHYGLELEGEGWRRVDGLRNQGRGGILGFGSTLAKQSGASRTSPILRGNWLSEVILGEKLPRPPKGVPILPEEAPEGSTERQLIEKHSSDPVCAKCHKRIDPFGFALEGFDAIGRSRTKDSTGLRIDTTTTLPDGTPIDGLSGLRQALLNKRSEDFERQFCRKLLGYALGRGIQLSDRPLIDAMVTNLQTSDHRVWSALELIVKSPQFRQVRGKDFEMLSTK